MLVLAVMIQGMPMPAHLSPQIFQVEPAPSAKYSVILQVHVNSARCEIIINFVVNNVSGNHGSRLCKTMMLLVTTGPLSGKFTSYETDELISSSNVILLLQSLEIAPWLANTFRERSQWWLLTALRERLKEYLY